MPRASTSEEVRILRFFEEAPIEKAELLFAIVAEKMRARSVEAGTFARRSKTRESRAGKTPPPASPAAQ